MTQLQSLPKLNKGSNFGMTKTVADVLKSRKFAKTHGYYSYKFVVNSIWSIYHTIDHLSVPYDIVLRAEKKARQVKYLCEAQDWMLLEAVNPDFAYPVLRVDKNLCCSLLNTSPPRIDSLEPGEFIQIPLKNTFLHKGIILMPKEVNGVKLEVAAYVFNVKDDKVINLVALTPKIGERAINTILMKEMSALEVDYCYKEDGVLADEHTHISFVANLFMYQASIKSKPEDYLEPVYAKSKGFGGGNHKGILSPRIIGEGYKPKVIRNYETTGTHASPRTHWRSGHWRQHMVGSRQAPEHKTIWIEPTLING